jgi:hypothetical protein
VRFTARRYGGHVASPADWVDVRYWPQVISI